MATAAGLRQARYEARRLEQSRKWVELCEKLGASPDASPDALVSRFNNLPERHLTSPDAPPPVPSPIPFPLPPTPPISYPLTPNPSPSPRKRIAQLPLAGSETGKGQAWDEYGKLMDLFARVHSRARLAAPTAASVREYVGFLGRGRSYDDARRLIYLRRAIATSNGAGWTGRLSDLFRWNPEHDEELYDWLLQKWDGRLDNRLDAILAEVGDGRIFEGVVARADGQGNTVPTEGSLLAGAAFRVPGVLGRARA